MKKVVIMLLTIFLISQVSAIETTLKTEYQPGETLITEISGNFIDNIKPEQIMFYSGRIYVPMIYDLSKIKDKYYLYSLLPIKERNYTLVIKNAHYFEAGQEKQEDLAFNFAVLGNTSLFTVNPGFIITNKDFNLKVTSNTKAISLETEFLNSSQEIAISSGQTKTLQFSVSEIKNFTFTNLKLTVEDITYEIPVAVFKYTNESDIIEKSEKLRFSKSSFNFTVLKDYQFEFDISLTNTGQEDIKNIAISVTGFDDIATLEPKEIDELKAGDLKQIKLIINSPSSGELNGSLSAVSDNYSAKSSLLIATTKNKEDLSNITAVDITTGSCSDTGGIICLANETCQGTSTYTLEGVCCLNGGCAEEDSGTSSSTIIILIIIFLLLAVIGFFVYRRMKFKRLSSSKILEEKSKGYEERFKPAETRGSLSRI